MNHKQKFIREVNKLNHKTTKLSDTFTSFSLQDRRQRSRKKEWFLQEKVLRIAKICKVARG